jgi:rhamnosyltransferase
MKIAATVILYYPDESVIKNILSYSNSIGKLYVVDNSETSSKQIKENVQRFNSAVYIHDGENKGIAARLNQVANFAVSDGFDWLLTMDQDSFFENELFTNYLNCIDEFENKGNVSMFGVNHTEQLSYSDICTSINVNHLITSGSALNLGLIEIIGNFDEKLFIDEVDFEYCLRSVAKGYDVIQFTHIFLSHNLGATFQHRSFKTCKLTPRVLHSPVRMYYMTRNFLYVQSQYRKRFSGELNQRKEILFNRVKNNVLYNKERFQVMKNIVKGFRDYRKVRMGKLK